MLTIFFILLKLTGSLLLSWWWIIAGLVFDLLIQDHVRASIRKAYLVGFEEGLEETKGGVR